MVCERGRQCRSWPKTMRNRYRRQTFRRGYISKRSLIVQKYTNSFSGQKKAEEPKVPPKEAKEASEPEKQESKPPPQEPKEPPKEKPAPEPKKDKPAPPAEAAAKPPPPPPSKLPTPGSREERRVTLLNKCATDDGR